MSFDDNNEKIYTRVIYSLASIGYDVALDWEKRCCNTKAKTFGMSNECQKLRRSKLNKKNKKRNK